jgi:hypothetical protein
MTPTEILVTATTLHALLTIAGMAIGLVIRAEPGAERGPGGPRHPHQGIASRDASEREGSSQ